VNSVRLKKIFNKTNDYTVLRVDRNKVYPESESNACPFGWYLLHFSGNRRLVYIRHSHKAVLHAIIIIRHTDSLHQSRGIQDVGRYQGKDIQAIVCLHHTHVMISSAYFTERLTNFMT
jgi:hypothetical protein